jgi:MFS family permease
LEKYFNCKFILFIKFLLGGNKTIDINKHNFLKYLLFGSLYFSEGLQAAITLVIVLIYLSEKGFSEPVATLVVGVAGIPWIIKFVFGGIVDHFARFGRKQFILIGGLIAAIGLIAAAFVDPGFALIPFTCFLFIARGGSALLDVSADAWAIEISREEERGKINGAMFGGMCAGSAVGGSLLAFIAFNINYSFAFLTAGLFIILVILFPLAIKEVKIFKKRQKIVSVLIGEFKKKTTQLVASFAFTSAIGEGLIIYAVPLYMATILELNVAQIGLIAAILYISRLAGSLIGGAMSDRWGRKTVLFAFLSPGIIVTAAFIFVNNWESLVIVYGLFGFLMGGSIWATSCALYMDVTNPRVGATQYSILTSLTNFGYLGIPAISGTLIAMLDFDRVFLYAAWAFGPALLILHFIRLKKQIRTA